MIKTNFNLLYVEDDISTQKIYKQIFERLFSKVDIASDGNEALSLVASQKYDVAILDINMPYHDGLDVVSRIKEMNLSMYIIMLTAFDDKDKLLRSIKLQVNDYLIKPVKTNLLIDTINKIKNKTNIVYFKNHIVWNKLDSILMFKNQKITLTKKEIALLQLLSTNCSRTYSNEEILENIWHDYDFRIIENDSLSKLISRFKAKVKKLIGVECLIIENCYSNGYKLNTLKN